MYECRCCEQPTADREWSAFARVKICPACRERERREGFFWRAKAEADALWLRAGVADTPPAPAAEDDTDWYALSNGLGTVMSDGTVIHPINEESEQ